MRRLYCFLFLLLNAAALRAQTAAPKGEAPLPVRFGKPEPADFEPQNFVADSAAPAVVLCDYGNARFGSVAGEMVIIYERTTRLKILKKAGYDYATVEVPLYHRGDDAEKLSNLHGFTYVREAGGQLTKTKLDPGQAFEEKRTENLKVRKFTLPAVREGAVVEYTYTVTSTFFQNYQDWTFQHDIPTRWSEYRSSIPRVYRYKILYRGYLPLTINEQGSGLVSLLLTNRLSTLSGAGAGLDVGSNSVSMNTEQNRWVIRNAPAFRNEPFITTPADYLARVSFELAGVEWPNEPYKDLTDSWPKKNQVLLEDREFGKAVQDAGFLEGVVKPLVAQYPDPAARAAAVRALVLQNVKYDGTNRLYAPTPLKKAWELHRGTAADVNLLLLAALRRAGLPAEPVILSTRAHGRVSQEYPLLEQFNYVVALVEVPGQTTPLLLDATEPLLPAGVLPRRCLSGVGRLVAAGGAEGRWVSLDPATRHVRYQEVKLTLDAAGNLSGQVRDEQAGYAALAARERLMELGEKKYVAEVASRLPGGEVPEFAFTNAADPAQPLALRYALRQPARTPAAEAGPPAELYLNPLAAFGERENPFRENQRRYPVDLAVPRTETISLTLTLPAGYAAELPKPLNLLLPGQGGRYTYSASQPAPGTVQLVSRLSMDRVRFAAEEYGALREFYRQMLAKQAEALVLKKL